MNFLYLLEQIRVPWLDTVMLTITRLGEETVFLVVALIMFWCVEKRHGYYLMAIGFLGTLANQFMKLLFRIPRPWVIDENFTILEQAREAASGYSFPSGHTQSAVGTFGVIAATTKRFWIRALAVAAAILVPFSRMYIGVHTPLDVVVAALIAVALIFIMHPVIYQKDGKYIPLLFCVMIVLSIAFLCYVELYPFPADIDQHNLASGTKNAYTLLGALLGLLVVYIADEKWIKFPTKAVLWAQLCKIVGGLGIVLLVKSDLKSPINALFGASVGTAVRYFLIVVVAGAIWPLTFRWFSNLGRKQ